LYPYSYPLQSLSLDFNLKNLICQSIPKCHFSQKANFQTDTGVSGIGSQYYYALSKYLFSLFYGKSAPSEERAQGNPDDSD
jgi:hypothetical protein